MKIVFFLGRIHHALKLMYLIQEMVKADNRIEILISDNAINIDPSTEFIPQFGIPAYNHVKDYLEPKITPDVDLITERLMDWVIPLANEGIPPFWSAFSIREAAENLVGMRNFLRMSQPDCVFGLHENNFWVKMLFYVAQDMGIKTYSLMEGIILDREEQDMGKYSIGTEYTDTLFSWSQDDKKYYQNPERIYASGPPHMDEWIHLANDPMKLIRHKLIFRNSLGIDAPTVLFAPPRLDLYAGDFGAHLELLSEWALTTGVGLILRLHPFQQGDFGRIFKRHPHIKVAGGPNGMPSVMGSDLVITQTSTIAIEALAVGTPVVQIDLDHEGLEQPIDCLDYWDSGETRVLERILKGYYDVAAQDKFRKEQLALFDGEATKRIIDYVVEK